METERGRSETALAVRELVARCLELLDGGEEAEVEALLAAHAGEADEVRRRLRELARLGLLAGPTASPVSPMKPGREIPERLGPFRLLERLGEGGMGVVYLALDETLSRTVALKVVRPELLHFEKSRERFRREIEAIARLKHPNILPVYSAGEEQGVPFFSMEWVEGCTLSDLLGELGRNRPGELTGAVLAHTIEALSPAPSGRAGGGEPARFGTSWTETCFRLAQAVAAALSHAHGQGVLHRDVKPSNVMVTRDGRVLLLDFGLAESSESSRITATGSHVGSLPYMSPEQVRGTAEVDARSDVYSLGVALYELLTLRCPYLAPNAEDTRRRILEGVPAPIRSLNPQVPWDAETVCLAAMDRDPERRYPSAAALARDLANFLEHRPIEARRPGFALRARRFTQRHPVASVAATLGCLLLVAAGWFGVAQAATNRALVRANVDKDGALEEARGSNEAKDLALGEAHAANAEKDAALAEARTALARRDQVNLILLSMIDAPDPWQSDPVNPIARETKVVEVLDRALAELEANPDLDPAVVAEVSSLLGHTYTSLELPERAGPLLERAHELNRELYGPDSYESVLATYRLASLRYDEGRLAEARELLESARAHAEASRAASEVLASILNDLGMISEALGDHARAEELHREQRAWILAGDPGRQDREVALALADHNLGVLLMQDGKLEEAETLLQEGLAIRQRLLDPGHPRLLASLNALGVLFNDQGRHAEALEIFESLLSQVEVVHGPEHERTLLTRISFASSLSATGQYERAEEQARAVLAAEGRVFARGDLLSFHGRLQLASSLVGQERFDEALEIADQALESSASVDAEARARIEELRARALEALDVPAEAVSGE